MKEINVRKAMYGQERKETLKKISTNELADIKTSRDVILIESGGVKQFVPSMVAFTKLLQDHDVLKNNHNKALKEITVLRESIKIIIRSVNEMDEELKRKVDKLDG